MLGFRLSTLFKKKSNRILKITHNKLFDKLTTIPILSLIISVIIIFSLPNTFNKYEVKLIKKEKNINNEELYYADLDNDGYSEKIRLIKEFKDKTGVIVLKNERTIDQWNFDGKHLHVVGAFWNDIDNDGTKELFIFTWKDGKILLNIFNPIKNKILLKNRIISEYKPISNTFDCTVSSQGFYDLNNDGFKEFYFSTDVAFSMYPRKMFAFNLKTDTLYSSPKSYAGINSLVPYDLDGDGKLEFINSSNAIGNSNNDQPYSDMYAWLMVFDSKMKFKFAPVKIGNYPSDSKVIVFKAKTKKFIAVLNTYTGILGYPSKLLLFNSKGIKVKEKDFAYSDAWEDANLLSNDNLNSNKFVILHKNGLIEYVDANLNVTKREKFFVLNSTNYFSLDIDRDKKNEFIFQNSYQDKIIITRNDFSNLVIFSYDENEGLEYSSIILNGNKPPELYLVFKNFSYTLNYGRNPLYFLKYFIYAGIYLFTFLFVLLIGKAQKHKVEQKYKAEKRIVELQLKSIKNQTDPHFTLNLLNSIGSLFYKQDIEKANFIFGKYSKLLRATILSSNNILTTLSNELEYVENYLELEKFRLNYKFDYKIQVDESIDRDIKIPKMLLHTFVENSVKHGVSHLDKDGEITIKIEKNKSAYIICVNDNGVGREKAKELSIYSTHKGFNILDQILDLYYSLMNIRITYKIDDLFDNEGKPRGTEVCIAIPIKNKL